MLGKICKLDVILHPMTIEDYLFSSRLVCMLAGHILVFLSSHIKIEGNTRTWEGQYEALLKTKPNIDWL